MVKSFDHIEVINQLTPIPFYFADPHAPWQRGTNENTNGILRKYFPKTENMSSCSMQYIDTCFKKLNERPCKYLGWRIPYELFFDRVFNSRRKRPFPPK